MTKQKLRELLDACFMAKRITETMPNLPHGMKPRHLHVLEAIREMGQNAAQVRVSDISKRLGITTPSVTKLINELVDMGAVRKDGAGDDKRFTLLQLTEKGVLLEKRYVNEYQSTWCDQLPNLTDEQVRVTIQVITSLYQAMPKGLKEISKFKVL